MAFVYRARAGDWCLRSAGTSNRSIGWISGILWSLGIIIISFEMYYLEIDVSRWILLISGAMMALFLYGGLCYWPAKDLAVSGVALLLWGFYKEWLPFPNIVLLVATLGIAYFIGNLARPSWAAIVYPFLFVWDIYAVWFSNIMSTIVNKFPDKLMPSAFDTFGFLYGSYVGAGDGLLSSIGLIMIYNLHGWKRAILYLVSIVFAFGAINFLEFWWKDFFHFGGTPLMVFISPITLLCLCFGRKKKVSF